MATSLFSAFSHGSAPVHVIRIEESDKKVAAQEASSDAYRKWLSEHALALTRLDSVGLDVVSETMSFQLMGLVREMVVNDPNYKKCIVDSNSKWSILNRLRKRAQRIACEAVVEDFFLWLDWYVRDALNDAVPIVLSHEAYGIDKMPRLVGLDEASVLASADRSGDRQHLMESDRRREAYAKDLFSKIRLSKDVEYRAILDFAEGYPAANPELYKECNEDGDLYSKKMQCILGHTLSNFPADFQTFIAQVKVKLAAHDAEIAALIKSTVDSFAE